MPESWSYIWIALAGGAAAFAHCLGMCGGFALHLAQGECRWRVLGRQLLWHLGRTTTYVFLGAIAGFFGKWLGTALDWSRTQDVLAYVAGGVMVLMGLVLLGLTPTRRSRAETREDSLLGSIFGRFLLKPTPPAALVMGMATGFLPCPIVVGFLALGVQTGSVLVGMAMMAALGVGTVWSLLALGLTGHLLTARLRRWGVILGGVVLVVLGIATALRGTEVYHRLLGCPPSAGQAAPASHPCCREKP